MRVDKCGHVSHAHISLQPETVANVASNDIESPYWPADGLARAKAIDDTLYSTRPDDEHVKEAPELSAADTARMGPPDGSGTLAAGWSTR